MYTAYHMIGLATLDLGRLGDPQSNHPDGIRQITERAHQRYQTIRTAGILFPGPKYDVRLRREGHFFLEDHLAGDDQYVFLSVGKRYWYEPKCVNFGFLFDAAVLIEEGAILRQYDLLFAYEELLSDLVVARIGYREPTAWSKEEQETLFRALDDPDAYPDYTGPNDAFYILLDAVRAQEDNVPGVSEIIQQFQVQVQTLQNTAQLVGGKALTHMETVGENGRCELLVKGHLALSQAIGRIEYGRKYR